MNKITVFFLAMIMVFVLCSCGVEEQAIEINYGDNYTIELEKQQQDLVWECDNTDVITVHDGVISGIAPGNATVIALKQDKSVAEISVTVNLVEISAVMLSHKNIEIEAEETMQLQ